MLMIVKCFETAHMPEEILELGFLTECFRGFGDHFGWYVEKVDYDDEVNVFYDWLIASGAVDNERILIVKGIWN